MRKAIAILLAVLTAPAMVFGQALADRIPGDAQVYVAWKGTDDLGAGYGTSHLKAIVDASQFSQFFRQTLPQLVDRLARGNPDANAKAHLALDLAGLLLRHPTAIYFGGVDLTNAASPMPRFAVVCDAGDDAAILSQKVTQLLSQMGQLNPLRCRTFGSLVVISTFDYVDHPAATLAENKQFQLAMSQQVSDPVVTLYVDGTASLATIDALVLQSNPGETEPFWPRFRDALGLDGLKYIAATDGFEGKNWATRIFVSAPAPRKGLLAIGDGKSISDDLLKLIPEATTTAGARYFDLNALFLAIDSALQQSNMDAANGFHQGLQLVNQRLGFDVQADLLASVGDQWAYYLDPSIAASGALGLTIINVPRNPAALETSLTSLENFVDSTMRGISQKSGKPPMIEIHRVASNGVTVHSWAIRGASPAWAIKDGKWYFALFPEEVVSAMNRNAGGASILDNPQYQAVMKELDAPASRSSFEFVDLKRTVPATYQGVLVMSRVYLRMANISDLAKPEMILPPLDKLLAECEPGGVVSWRDDAGFHVKAIMPFAGADATGNSMTLGTIGGTSLAVSILLPSLNRARETANRVKCASNMRQIGQGILLYSNDHQGAYPPDLGALVKEEPLTAEVFVCPDSDTSAPHKMTADQAHDWVNAHSDYLYLGAGLTQQTALGTTVVLYERDNAHRGDGMNILYGDGHVEFWRLRDAKSQINERRKGMQQP